MDALERAIYDAIPDKEFMTIKEITAKVREKAPNIRSSTVLSIINNSEHIVVEQMYDIPNPNKYRRI